MKFDTELVGKIGSMALIDRKANCARDISGFRAAQWKSGVWTICRATARN